MEAQYYSVTPQKDKPYRIHFAAGRTIVAGKIVEVVPNERIALSWGVEKGE